MVLYKGLAHSLTIPAYIRNVKTVLTKWENLYCITANNGSQTK